MFFDSSIPRNAPRRRLHRRRGLRGRYSAHGPDSFRTLEPRWRGRIAPPPLVRRAASACAPPHTQPGQEEQSGSRRSTAAAQAAGTSRVPQCCTYDWLSGGLASGARALSGVCVPGVAWDAIVARAATESPWDACLLKEAHACRLTCLDIGPAPFYRHPPIPSPPTDPCLAQ